ncbi:MAG: YihY/virulence factor BrkB family protein [Bdellovibrionales bacterium]
MSSVFSMIKALIRESLRPQVRILAMGLSYLTLFSIVPILGLLALFVATYDPSVTERFLLLLFTPLGSLAQFIVEHLMGFIDKVSLKNIGYLGVGIALVTWFSMLRMIETATNEIWHLQPRALNLKSLLFHSFFVIISPIVITTATVVITLQSSKKLNLWIIEFFNLNKTIDIIGFTIASLSLTFVFTAIYFIAPNCKIRIKYALFSGVISAIGWIVIGSAFTRLLQVFARFDLIYSSLSSIFIFASWIFFSWMVVLTGVQLTFLLHHRVFVHLSPDGLPYLYKNKSDYSNICAN